MHKRPDTCSPPPNVKFQSSIIVAACLIGLVFSVIPAFFNAISVFMKGIISDTGWSRSAVASGISAALLAGAISTPFIGALADRFGPKRIIVVSTLSLSFCLIVLGQIPLNYGLYLLISAVIGVAGLGTSSFLSSMILSQWFDRRFGLSLGIAMIGTGIGSALSPLICQHLQAHYGWQGGFTAIGLGIAILALPNAIFFIRESSDRSTAATTHVVGAAIQDVTPDQAVKTAVFWKILVAVMLTAVVANGCSLHLVSMFTDRGLSAASASKYLSLFGISTLVSRFLAGLVLDHIRPSVVGAVSFAAPAVGIALIVLNPGELYVLAAILLLGIGYGVEGDLLPYMVRRHFGMKAYGVICGIIFAAFSAGALIGPLLMGASFDVLHTYTPALYVFVAFSLLSALLIGCCGDSRKENIVKSLDAPATSTREPYRT